MRRQSLKTNQNASDQRQNVRLSPYNPDHLEIIIFNSSPQDDLSVNSSRMEDEDEIISSPRDRSKSYVKALGHPIEVAAVQHGRNSVEEPLQNSILKPHEVNLGKKY